MSVTPIGEEGLDAAQSEMPAAIMLDVLLPGIDAWEARAVLAESPIDLDLVDVRLPGSNGLELATGLRAQPDARRPNVVIVSASVLPDERMSALATGADAFLAKPFKSGELVDLLVRLRGETA